MMIIDPKFMIGEIVYLVTDEEQLKRIVTGYLIRSGNLIEYLLSHGSNGFVYAVDIEITKVKMFI
tara:strand:- start:19642 stop:19836 length:195 start_codon:yes stop_codon:yes gene_type:complete